MKTKEEFKKWFAQIVPKSYEIWFGKKIDEKYEEISKSYLASFGKDVFEIDPNNIENEIIEIQRNINGRNDVVNKSFSEYDKSASNGIPKAILGKWFTKYLRSLNNGNSVLSSNELKIESDQSDGRIQYDNLSFSYESDLQKSLISQSEVLFPDYQIDSSIVSKISGISSILESFIKNLYESQPIFPSPNLS